MATASAAPPLLDVDEIEKSYAAPVLSGVSLRIRAGEVHALLGANGAGKSTLARIVAGLVRPERGRMELEGRDYAPAGKRDAEERGVQIVQQELNLVETLSVAENLFLGALPARAGFVDRAELEARARRALAAVGLDCLAPGERVGRLGVGVRQLVVLAAALARRTRLLVLDEPTAALAEQQVETLFENVRRIVSSGVGVLYISHRLEEVARIADWATVLRDGKVVVSAPIAELSQDEILRAMSGRAVERASSGERRSPGAPALIVEKLGLRGRFTDVSFSARRGEILGLSGLVGSGRTRLLRAIVGAERADAGGIFVGDRGPFRFSAPFAAKRAGIGMVPEDRRRDGLLLARSVRLNVVLGVLGRLGPWLGRDVETTAADEVCDDLEVDRKSPLQTVAELSGGNQQKVVIARWLLAGTDVLLFDEPTRGIDASTRAKLYRRFDELARSGKAIVVASSDLDELMTLCDRIAVLSAGRLVDVFERGAWSREELHRAAFHAHVGTDSGR